MGSHDRPRSNPKKPKQKSQSLSDDVLSIGLPMIRRDYPQAVTWWEVRNLKYFAFALTQDDAMALRRADPKLKHGHIRNMLMMFPRKFEIGKLYPSESRPVGRKRYRRDDSTEE